MDDIGDIVEEYDPLKDFAKRKPTWCGGELEVKKYSDCTKYYANFRGGCGWLVVGSARLRAASRTIYVLELGWLRLGLSRLP